MRLAFDTVPRCVVEAAVVAGHELTIWRDHEEPLHHWLTRVRLSQADGIVSASRHVGRYAFQMGLGPL